MNKNELKEKVFEALNEVIAESDMSITPYDEMELNRENGIDSLGIVSLVVLLEEKLEFDADKYLADIRNCKRVTDLVELMEKIKRGDG